MKMRYTIVDDAAFLRELIKNILNSTEALCVGEADNGQEGLALVTRTLPDVVFLDMVMPVLNGLETAKQIRQAHPEVKIIGCSTLDGDEWAQKAQVAGFDAYVTKPFTKNQLLEAIRKVLPHLEESSHGRT